MLNPSPSKSLTHSLRSIYFDEGMMEGEVVENSLSIEEQDSVSEARGPYLSLRNKNIVNYSDQFYFQERLSYSQSQERKKKRSREAPKDRGFKFVIPEPCLLSSSDDESEINLTTSKNSEPLDRVKLAKKIPPSLDPQKRRKVVPSITKTSLSSINSGADDELNARLDLLVRASEMLSGARVLNSESPRQNLERQEMIFVGTPEDFNKFRSLEVAKNIECFVASDDKRSYSTSGYFVDRSVNFIDDKRKGSRGKIVKALVKKQSYLIESSESRFNINSEPENQTLPSVQEIRNKQLEELEIKRNEELENLQNRNLEKLNELICEYSQKFSNINQAKKKIEDDYKIEKHNIESEPSQSNIEAIKNLSQMEEEIKLKFEKEKDQIESRISRAKTEIEDKYKKEEREFQAEQAKILKNEIIKNESILSEITLEKNRADSLEDEKFKQESREVKEKWAQKIKSLKASLEKLRPSQPLEIGKIISSLSLESKGQSKILPPFALAPISAPQLQEIRIISSLKQTWEKLTKIVTNPIYIDFFNQNDVYKSFLTSLNQIEQRKLKYNVLGDILKIGASDDELINCAKVFLDDIKNKTYFEFFKNLLKKGSDAINESISKREMIEFVFNKLLRSNNVKLKGSDINCSKLIEFFVESDFVISRDDFDKIVVMIQRCKNSNLLDKLIRKNPEFINPKIIHNAVNRDSPRMILSIFMTSNDFDINQRDADGNTVFHHISKSLKLQGRSVNSQMAVVSLLLLLGGDPSIRNNKNELPTDRLRAESKSAFNDIIELMSNFCKLKEVQEKQLSSEAGLIDEASREENIALQDIIERKTRACDYNKMKAEIGTEENLRLLEDFKTKHELEKKQYLENLNKKRTKELQQFEASKESKVNELLDEINKREVEELQKFEALKTIKIKEALEELTQKKEENLKILEESKSNLFRINQEQIQKNQESFEANKNEINLRYDDGQRLSINAALITNRGFNALDDSVPSLSSSV